MEIESNKKYHLFLYLIGLFTCIYFFALNIIGTSYDFFPGDLGDARFNNYLLEHCYQFFCGNIDSFWNAPFMYPEKNIITYSDNLIGTSPFYSLFRILGFDRIASFQNWFLLMTAFNFTSCFIFLKYVFKNIYAAILGALIFTCSIALQAQIGHAQTIARFPIPLGLMFGLLYSKELNPKYFLFMLLTLTYQFYCGIYLGFLMSVPIILLIIISIFIRSKLYIERIKKIYWIISMTIFSILSVTLLAFLLLPYKERAEIAGLYQYENIVSTVPTFKSFFYSNSGSLFWSKLEHVADDYSNYWDYRIFPGGIAVFSVIFCLMVVIRYIFRKKRSEKDNYDKKILLLTGLFTFFLFVRIDNVSFYRILFNLPGFGSMRALQRIINIELLFFSVTTAYFFLFVFRNNRYYINFILFLFFAFIIVIDNSVNSTFIHRTKKTASENRVNNLLEKMKFTSNDSIISYEPDSIKSAVHEYHLDAMLATQSLGLKCLNGYSATAPEGYHIYWGNPNVESRKNWLSSRNISTCKIKVIK